MSNPWGITLRKTGLNAERIEADKIAKENLENRQSELAANAALNKENKDNYYERQSSLGVSAMMGQQERLGLKREVKCL